MICIVIYTTHVCFVFHNTYHYLKHITKNKQNFIYKLLTLNKLNEKRENLIYKNHYSENLIFDPIIVVVVWFCMISYLFFPFKYFHSLVYGMLTLFINYYTHAEFNLRQTYFKKIKFFVYFKKKHDEIHYKYHPKYERYKHLKKIIIK
jgi:hypothetical protein